MNGAVCKNGNYATEFDFRLARTLDGEWYLLDTADGHRLSGLQKNEVYLYYLDPEQNDKMFKSTNQEDGWKQLNGTWYFFRGWGGALNNGWNKLGNDWYCFMKTARWQVLSGSEREETSTMSETGEECSMTSGARKMESGIISAAGVQLLQWLEQDWK